MITPLGALLDPLGQNIDFCLCQRLFLVWHALFSILRIDPSNQLAVPWIARDYSQLTGLSGIQGFLPEQQTELGISLYTPMAADTPLIKNRLYLGAKINFLLVTAC